MSDEKRFGIEQFGEGIERILVVAAHPDDLETAAGGIISLFIDRGARVALLLGTDGDIGTHDLTYTRATLAETRRRETLDAARVLGLEDVFFLGLPDGELVADLALRAAIANIYRRWQPDTVFTFDPYWSGQAHPDHTAAGRAAVEAYMPSKMELYHPEQLVDGVKVADVKRFFFFGGSNREGEITVDIAPAWQKKLAATRCHVSQFGQKEEALKWLEEWNRETGKCCGLEFAESFYAMHVW
ncbi:MAG: Mycothiol S-conjugate amidase [Chloroflexi bacterium ADurb.Bin325]|nr:MAG: Mycothiol S-conjugate amidase [Chloroflexi bacterium ADurb.Bin325]